jgi:dolichol-phosphate mannosyltransferase
MHTATAHHLWVLIPTYNERDALPLLLPQLIPTLRTLPEVAELRVLIIDDNSPDGTGALVEELAETWPELRVLHRTKKEGLGPAYTAGMHHAVSQGATKIIQMDVDGSHQPQHIPALWNLGKDQAAVAGSRYCPGGSIAGWNKIRRTLSKIIAWYGRTMLQLSGRDGNSGFRCWDAALLLHILPFVNGSGFVFQVELTYCAERAGAQVDEVPIAFIDREVGKSKASWKIAVEEAWRVAKLRSFPPKIAPYEPSASSSVSTAASHD